MTATDTATDTGTDTGTGPGQRDRFALLWRYARPQARSLVLAGVLGLGVSASGLVSPLATREVLGALGSGESLADPILLLLALIVVGAGMSWWQWRVLGAMAEHVVYDVREGMIRRYLQAKVLPLLARPSGELVTRVTSDSVLLREAASSSVIGLINAFVLLIGTLVLMAVLDLVLALATVGSIAVVTVLFVMLMPAIGVAQGRSQAALGELGGELDGTLRAIKTVKAAGAEPRQVQRLLEHAQQARIQSLTAVRREALVWTIAWTGVETAILVILGVGAWRVDQGAMDVPTLIAFLLYAFGLIGPVMEISQNATTLQTGLAAAGRISEVESLEVEQQFEQAGPTRSPDAGAPVVELAGVTARYAPGVAPAVRELDLVIPARGHIALVGPSGAGKTTVFSLILRFLEPEHGQLRLNGVPYEQIRPAEVRRHLAYVEQETPVVPGTIRENLLYANPDATDSEVTDVLKRIRLQDKIDELPDGLDTRLGDSTVSGGQRQRIALARALLARPAVLLLDEATAQVDGITEAAIHDAVRQQAREGAVVTIAHRLSTVLDADQIVVMQASRVVARGTHEELLRDSPLYAELVAALRIGDQLESSSTAQPSSSS
ncbi:ABC transporter ATP-binding protein/permease [Kineosporia rhizophila]|uniref:ABC transporter ATP-binding protein n=1 Tax=Kineosporia rhizophila TaxID=84633 RepID=UPI001E346704|nr:ABC transporter ATP-binding protein [Kineosporia rhizophila]MCE0536456.1 ABC transporter ATP-binding protein/permease [Kineosporia rhizophila]